MSAEGLGIALAQEFLDDQVRAQKAVWPTALVHQLRCVLRPAIADSSQYQVVRNERRVEDDFAKVCRSVDEWDRANADTGSLELDEHL